ncbi:MAG: SapC family protein [Pseudomonadota bacterium]
MTDLVELTSSAHGDLRILQDAKTKFAADQHVLALRANEVGQAASCFAVFFTRSQQTGDAALSAITSISPGNNLFVKDGVWTATHEPSIMQTYPFFLMRADNQEKGYTVGVDADSAALSRSEGEPLFQENGQPSMHLSKITSVLEANLEHDVQTRLFTESVEKLGLQKSVNLVVYLQNGESQTITGLRTIDEDKLKSLDAKVLQDLNAKGYLVAIHAMLLSIFQLNLLIRRYNEAGAGPTINQIKLEVARSAAGEPLS